MNSLSLSHLPRLLELIVKEEVDGTLSINQSLLQADEVLLLLQGLLLALLTLPGQLEPLELGLAVVVDVVVSTGTHFETGQQAPVSRTRARYPSGHGHPPSSTHLDLLQVHS